MHIPTFTATRDDYIAMIREWDTIKADQIAADPDATFTKQALTSLRTPKDRRELQYSLSDIDTTIARWHAETPYWGDREWAASILEITRPGVDSVTVDRYIAPGALEEDEVRVLVALHSREGLPVHVGSGEL